jgi:hypothetical protein
MREALLLVFLIITTILIFIFTKYTEVSDGFIDVEKMHTDFVDRQLSQWGDIGISLITAKKVGRLGDSADKMLQTPGENGSYPLRTVKDGLWKVIDKCEAIKTMDCGAFDNAEFSKDCGVCLDIGMNSDRVPATGGLVLLADDKKVAREGRQSNFLPDYVATIGFCPAGKLVSTKEECLKLQRQLLCNKNSSYDQPGCSQCYSDTSYSIVDPKTSPGVINDHGVIYIVGEGQLIISEAGRRDKTGINLHPSSPYKYTVRGAEGSRIKFKISPPANSDEDNPIVANMAGIITSETATGDFSADLRRIVLVDEVTGRKPRSKGKTTVKGTPVSKMAPGYGQDSATIVAIIPFSFVDTTTMESTLCKDAPFVTTQAAAEFLESDPCYKKGSGPGKFSLECLQTLWEDNSCTAEGRGYPGDTARAAALMTDKDGSFLSLNDIADSVYNRALVTATGVDEEGKKLKIQDWSAASVFCTGREITSPCDTDKKNSGPLSPECIIHLWNNQSSKKTWQGRDDPIGPTYYNSNAVSLFQEGPTLRSCQTTGTLSPIDPNGNRKKEVVRYWQRQGGVNNVKRVMADLHRAANAQRVADDQLSPYFKQCYGDIAMAPRPPTLFACHNSAGLPQSYTPTKGAKIGEITMTQDYKLDFDVTPRGTTGNWGSIIHFTRDGNRDYGEFGFRTPAIWFTPGGMGLHVRIGDANGDHNWGFDNPAGCAVGKKSHVSLECRGKSVRLTIDSNSYSLTQPTYRYSGPLMIYGCDPWYDAANASVENLCLQLLGNSTATEPAWITKLKNGGWRTFDGGLTNITISDTGVIFGVNSNDNIYRRDGINSGWRQLGGALVQIAAQGGDTVVGANRGTAIYRGDGNGGWWHIPGGAHWTGASPNGDTWVIGTNGTQWGNYGFWRKDGSNAPNWGPVAGAAKMLSMGAGELWCVQDNGNIFRWNGGGWELKPKPNGVNAKSVAVSVNGKRIMCIADNAPNGVLFAWHQNNWIQVTGHLKQIAISDTMIVGVSTADQIWYLELPPN